MLSSSIPNLQTDQKLLLRWGKLWGLPWLKNPIIVEVSDRFRSSLGKCDINKRIIRLNSILLNINNKKIRIEALCHEAAHLAVYELYGRNCRPHGTEWKSLVKKAGYEPRIKVPLSEVKGLLRLEPRYSNYLYVHRCNECQSTFTRNRTDKRWRCNLCQKSGLDGVLSVSRIEKNYIREEKNG